MTDKEINSATIAAFIARAINRASVTAVDAQFGLRVLEASSRQDGTVHIHFPGDHVAVLTIEHLVPRSSPSQRKDVKPDARL